MGIVVWKKFPLVALIIFLALYFSTGMRELTVLIIFIHQYMVDMQKK